MRRAVELLVTRKKCVKVKSARRAGPESKENVLNYISVTQENVFNDISMTFPYVLH